MASFRLQRFVIAALPLLVASGCTSPKPAADSIPATPQPPNNGQLRVIATFLPMYLFTKAVAGQAARVSILLKPGTEVHEYQSTPADVQAIAQADVVVKNGLGLETFLDGTLQSAENPKLKVIDASQGIQPIADPSSHADSSDHADDHADQSDQTDTHAHQAGNPHVWLDPVLAQKQVENIRDGLIAADSSNKQTYQANAAAYIQQLSKLNQQFQQGLQGYRDRSFVTFHDAFLYLAKRYQLQQVAVVEIPEDQISPQNVQRVVSVVKQLKAKALFSEAGMDNKLLSSLSQDLKLPLLPLNSLEIGQPDPQYYFTAMQENLKTLKEGFQ